MTTTPRFKINDKVTIRSGPRAVWEIKGIEEPTRLQPQWGYRVERDNGHGGKTVNESSLELAEAEVRT